MYCKICGKELPEDAIFCCHCGVKLTDTQLNTKREVLKNTILVEDTSYDYQFIISSTDKDTMDKVFHELKRANPDYMNRAEYFVRTAKHTIEAKCPFFGQNAWKDKVQVMRNTVERLLLENGFNRTVVIDQRSSLTSHKIYTYEKKVYESQ